MMTKAELEQKVAASLTLEQLREDEAKIVATFSELQSKLQNVTGMLQYVREQINRLEKEHASTD